MHSNPVRLLIERRKEPNNFLLILLPEPMKTPSTILSGAPGKQCPFHVSAAPVPLHIRPALGQRMKQIS